MGDDDIDAPRCRLPDSLESCGAGVGEQGARAAREHRGHPAPLGWQVRAPEGIDAAVDAVGAADSIPISAGRVGVAERPQLRRRNDSVLPRGKGSEGSLAVLPPSVGVRQTIWRYSTLGEVRGGHRAKVAAEAARGARNVWRVGDECVAPALGRLSTPRRRTRSRANESCASWPPRLSGLADPNRHAGARQSLCGGLPAAASSSPMGAARAVRERQPPTPCP